jgi:DNA-binding transcriptional MocR family regulator
MTVEWEKKFCERAHGMFGSMTRRLMHLIADPGVISFGGGLPAGELFPAERIKEITDDILAASGPSVLQYGTSEGYGPLRRAVAERYRRYGFAVDRKNVLITSGAQQGIDLVSKLFIGKGDTVVVGDPTFLTALQGFGLFQANCFPVPLDREGMRVDLLPDILEHHPVKLIYVMPNFQNPSGITLSLSRRKSLMDIARRYQVPIVEDDAYGELRYGGSPLPALKAMDTENHVIYLGSFSKVLSPGIRVSALIAPEDIMEKLVFAKQAADLHTDNLAQRIVFEFLQRDLLDPHIRYIVNGNRKRRDAMLRAMDKHLPGEMRWIEPDGGIFIWAALPRGLDAMALFKAAIEAKVAYVPGSCYFAKGGGDTNIRLNFTACNEEKIEAGIQRLAGVIEENMI